jgi:hypothetical protein
MLLPTVPSSDATTFQRLAPRENPFGGGSSSKGHFHEFLEFRFTAAKVVDAAIAFSTVAVVLTRLEAPSCSHIADIPGTTVSDKVTRGRAVPTWPIRLAIPSEIPTHRADALVRTGISKNRPVASFAAGAGIPTARVRTARVRTARVRTTRVRPTRIGPTRVRISRVIIPIAATHEICGHRQRQDGSKRR